MAGTGETKRPSTLTPLPVRRRTVVAYRRGAGRHPAVEAAVMALRAAVPQELAHGRVPPSPPPAPRR
ncbi:hypothetical protein GCM10010358_11540 [Streptomyces minutiscleroticus]|uniref:Uncharacterized protein n=1 Tax=Streptomyces minutiscleroticus TaxID=68238 RepID=A0A918KCX6_9ACTN|nr:hypothetical protein [Streptomyces minutiscleroticus]GGX59017.1 hypothetical protein GCM10010358_11540 [Streptomyces minutiscleroticus]